MLLLQAEQLPEAKTSFPDLLQRVLDSCTERAQGLHPLMLLTVHAVMLETGMQLANQVTCCALCCKMCLLSLYAPVPEVPHLVKAVKHVLQENKCAPPAEALSSCSNVCQLEYALQQQQRPNICQVKYISLGSGMACIAAALNGSKVAMVNLSLTYHLKWQQQQQGEHSLCAKHGNNVFQRLCMITLRLQRDLAGFDQPVCNGLPGYRAQTIAVPPSSN